MSSSISVAEKRRVFRRLHESGCFAIPNPWDVGSARYLEPQASLVQFLVERWSQKDAKELELAFAIN